MPPQGHVTFNEEQFTARRAQTALSGLTAWVIAQGFAKDEKGANTLMLMVAGVAVLIAIIAPMILGGSGGETLSPEERAKIEATIITPR